MLDEIVAHAQRDAPNECCGVLATRDGEVLGVHATENIAASPMRFEVEGPVLIRLLDEIEGGGADLGAIYHSHTRSEAYPSQTDINFAANWPGVEWLIVGLKPEEPEVRSYLIDGGEVTEVPVEVT
ncbi:MAG: M67 family metallopeptidase [Solirubrobacteraceae bacterium]|nr:M67 family metallopeptidase [Solirubrobacteraceae bacterium]